MKTVAWLSGALVLASSGSAMATLPGAQTPGAASVHMLTDANDAGHDIFQFGNAAGRQVSQLAHSSAYSKVKLTPFAGLDSRAKTDATFQATAVSQLSYDYVVHANSQSAYDALLAYSVAHLGVGTTISGSAALKVTALGSASASIDAGTGVTAFDCQYYGGSCVPGSGHLQYSSFRIGGLFLSTDAIGFTFLGHIDLTARADASEALGNAYAFIDPLVALPGDFGGDISAYSFVLSDGVANANGLADVPEPASWAMMIAGFGLTGLMARRRRFVRA